MTGRRRTARAGEGARGFTLLELLVGLVAFALLVATAYAGLRTGARSVEAGETRIAAGETRRLVAAFLRRQIEGAVPLAVVRDRRWRLWLDGEAERLVLVADLPAHLDGGGPHELLVEARTAPDGHRELVLGLARLDLGADPGERAEQADARVLVADLRAFRADYYGRTTAREEPRWRERWRGHRLMPELVRLRIADAAGDWPELVVHPRVDAVRYVRAGREAGAGAAREGAPGPETAGETTSPVEADDAPR